MFFKDLGWIVRPFALGHGFKPGHLCGKVKPADPGKQRKMRQSSVGFLFFRRIITFFHVPLSAFTRPAERFLCRLCLFPSPAAPASQPQTAGLVRLVLRVLLAVV